MQLMLFDYKNERYFGIESEEIKELTDLQNSNIVKLIDASKKQLTWFNLLVSSNNKKLDITKIIF